MKLQGQVSGPTIIEKATVKPKAMIASRAVNTRLFIFINSTLIPTSSLIDSEV